MERAGHRRPRSRQSATFTTPAEAGLCSAYQWSHRPGGGLCRWPEEPEYRLTTAAGTHREDRDRTSALAALGKTRRWKRLAQRRPRLRLAIARVLQYAGADMSSGAHSPTLPSADEHERQPLAVTHRLRKATALGAMLLVIAVVVAPVSFAREGWDGLAVALAVGLSVGLVHGLAGGLVGALVYGLVYGLSGGLSVGLVFGLSVGLVRGLVYGLVGGLAGGLIVGLVGGLMGGLVFGLLGGLMRGLGGLMGGLVYGLSVGPAALAGLLLGAALRQGALELDDIAKYLRAMLTPVVGYALIYFLIVLWFAGLYGTAVRVGGSQVFDRSQDAAVQRLLVAHDQGLEGSTTPTEPSFGEFLYFSLMTMTTLGYSDLVPASPLAKGLTSFQAILGTAWLVVGFAAVIAYLEPKFAKINEDLERSTPVGDEITGHLEPLRRDLKTLGDQFAAQATKAQHQPVRRRRHLVRLRRLRRPALLSRKPDPNAAVVRPQATRASRPDGTDGITGPVKQRT